MNAIDPTFSGEYRTASREEAGFRRVRKIATASDPQILQAVDAVLQACPWEFEMGTLERFDEAFQAGLTIINAETWSAFGSLLIWGKLGADVEKRLRLAERVTPADLEKAESVRRAFSQAVDAALEGMDALVLPTLPAFPPTVASVRAGASVIGVTSLVRPFNLSGHPALSIPIPTSSGIKAGLQLIGRRGMDAALCVLGNEVEQALLSM
jgi:amidase